PDDGSPLRVVWLAGPRLRRPTPLPASGWLPLPTHILGQGEEGRVAPGGWLLTAPRARRKPSRFTDQARPSDDRAIGIRRRRRGAAIPRSGERAAGDRADPPLQAFGGDGAPASPLSRDSERELRRRHRG